MKKILHLFFFALITSVVVAQTYPFVDAFETYSNFTTLGTQGGYMSDMSVYGTHGFAGSKGLISPINQFNHGDSTVSPLVGPVTLTSEVSFYYRICDASLYPATATTLMSGDKIEIYGGNQQVGAYQLLATIDMSNHVASTSFIKKIYALPTIFAGNPGNIKIKVMRGNTSTIDCFFDFDSLVVKDAAGVVTPPTVTFTTQNEQCFGANDGCVNALTTGGTGPYVYSWDNGANTSQICNLNPGVYCVTVTDGNSQTVSKCDTVLAATQITATASITNVFCYGSCNGSISLTVSGGTGPYNYDWNTGNNTGNISGLCAGTYSVTIVDGHNCTRVYDFTITQPDSISITSTQVNIDCFGFCTGSITANVTGGVSPYNILWSSGSNTNLCAGNNSITVTDNNGCSATQNYVITQNAQLVVTTSFTNVTTNGGNDGTISFTATGGVGPPYFSQVGSIPGGQIQNPNQLDAGCYWLTVSDSLDCVHMDTICISQPTSIAELNKNNFDIYPNPVNDLLTIKANEATSAEVSLINSIGEIVKRENFIASEMKLDVGSLAQGNYLFQLKTTEGIFRKNISVVK
ncbi:MAG: T9SS type A sorting domain-containing protein [Bacteroidetes bacterium]|nr:T9SS type A sorting domain-containing protein [Bacteroidota bacterium]